MLAERLELAIANEGELDDLRDAAEKLEEMEEEKEEAEEEAREAKKELDKETERAAGLERRIAELEAKVAELEARPPALPVAPGPSADLLQELVRSTHAELDKAGVPEAPRAETRIAALAQDLRSTRTLLGELVDAIDGAKIGRTARVGSMILVGSSHNFADLFGGVLERARKARAA